MNESSLQSFTLRAKLLLLAASLVVIPGVIGAAIAVTSSRAALAETILDRLVEEAREGAGRLATSLATERERIEALAAQDVMREIRISDYDKRVASLLASAARSCPACDELLAVDGQGRVVAASRASSIGKQIDAAGPPGVEGSFVADGRSLVRVTVVVPDPDAGAQPIGRLVSVLDWERLSQAVTDRVRGDDFDELVIDADGVVIAAAEPATSSWRRGDRLSLPSGADTSGRVQDGPGGTLIGFARLEAAGVRWGVVAAQPAALAFAPVRRLAWRLGILLAVTLTLALAVALLAARRVTQPLAELARSAAAAGAGQRPFPAVEVTSRDEIGSLAFAFNRMGADLDKAEHELIDAAKFSFAGQLAAGVAHEVRTPLGVLRSAAQLLERSLEPKDEDARELLGMLRGEVDRIDRVVSALLELGRPRPMQVERFALGSVVFRAADFVQTQARQQAVTLRKAASGHDPVVLGDPELIYQVALNLLVNAVQILADGGTIDAVVLPGDGETAAFEVCDDGPGMSEDVRARLFEPFFTRRPGGAGLGLTFVQRIVQEHRGSVTARPRDGGGTVFRVDLPLAPEAA